jgi:PAS domain S-box-containing protein
VAPWLAYLFAVAITAATLSVRFAMDGPLDGQPTLVIFTVPIMLSGYVGGLRAGLLATALSYFAASYFLLPPINSFQVALTAERWQQFFVAIAGVVISVLNEALHRARRRAQVAMQAHQQMDQALQESQGRYRALVEWSPEAIAVHRNGILIFVNPAAIRLFGADGAQDLLGRSILDLIHPDFHGATETRMKESQARNVSAPRMEIKVRRLDGTLLDAEVQGTTIIYDGEPALVGSLRDVSQRKAHEIEIDRLNRIYSALSHVNQAIVRMPTREELFRDVCRIFVEQGGVRLAWIGWHIPDAQVLMPVAKCGDEHNSVHSLPIATDNRPESNGPSATAFREGRPFVCNDMLHDPVTLPWREKIVRGNFQSCAVFPIRSRGEVSGVLSVYATEPNFFQDKEIALLAEAADDISFALDNLSREAERERADTSARESLKNANDMRDAIDQHALVAVTDARGKITFANDKFCKVSGYSREELLGKDHRIINSGHHPREFVRDLWETIRRGDAWHGEFKNRAKNGTFYWVDTTIVPFLNSDGSVRQYMAIRAVITERKEAELALRVEREALRTAEERMRFALQSANVGIWDMDYVTGVLQWSEILEAQYGLAPGVFAGTFEAFAERIHPDDRTSMFDVVERAMKFGDDFSTLHRAVWPDGTVRMLSGAGRVLLGNDGEPVRGIGISLDITERRTLEDQFQQAQKMEAVGRLAGGVAHDFNNLLTVMLGFCELLLSDLGPDSPNRADVEEIQKAGASAAGLTRQLLAFSRKQIIEPTLIDLSDVVADMRAMIERLIGEDVRVVLSLQPGLPGIMADRAQVEQVIMNLAVNARDAMPGGGVLTIETASAELDEHYARTHFSVTPGEYIVLTVSDNGAGMTRETQARLFEPFFTTKEIGKGTGLGLATVHGIVTRGGGTINVYSEIGTGTSFKVYLPKANGIQPAVTARAVAGRLQVEAHTVLVVEDAEGLRELTKRLLERQGYTVFVAANADEALELFDHNASIDVLLTDVVMPGISGPELSKQLVARRPTLRVVYMSGYTDEAIVHHGVLNPGIALLNKPFTSDALEQKIRKVLEQ